MIVGNKIIDILIAEDNPDDILIVKKAIKEVKVINTLHVVRDGQEAIDFLFCQGEYQDISASGGKWVRPDLILLDINMPKMNGIEVLKKIKEDNSLKVIPVIMLTVSKREEDIVKSYGYGCNSFLQKPIDFDKFVELVKEIGFYWGAVNIPCGK